MNQSTFALSDILSALDELGTAYQKRIIGKPRMLRFCSLRRPEPNGFYYFEGNALPSGDFSDSVFLTTSGWNEKNISTITVAHPQLVFYKLMDYFFQKHGTPPAGIHPTAVIDHAADISETASIGPFCVIGRAVIGAGVRLHSHVVVMDNTVIGNNVTVESHSCIGATGVAWRFDPESGERIVQPQIGGVKIGEGCFLGSDISVVRGSVNEMTEIGKNCMIAHGTKIGHGCRIGDEVHCANNVTLAGNVTVKNRAFLGSGCTIRSHVVIAGKTVIGAGAVVVKDITEDGNVYAGVPARRIQAKEKHAGVPKNIIVNREGS